MRLVPLAVVLGLAVAFAAPAVASPADVDNDGTVTMADLAAFVQACRNFRAGAPEWNRRCDMNTDGILNHTDFALFIEAFLRDYRPTASLADFFPADCNSANYSWALPQSGDFAGQTNFIDDEQPALTLLDDISEWAWGYVISWQKEAGKIVGFAGLRDTAWRFFTTDVAGGLRPPDPMELGQTYTRQAKLMNGDVVWADCTVTFQFLEADRTITVPAGTFAGCKRLRVVIELANIRSSQTSSTTDRIIYDIYSAPGVGPIKQLVTPPDGWCEARYIILDTSQGQVTYGQQPPRELMAHYWPAAIGMFHDFTDGTRQIRVSAGDWAQVDGYQCSPWGGLTQILGVAELLLEQSGGKPGPIRGFKAVGGPRFLLQYPVHMTGPTTWLAWGSMYRVNCNLYQAGSSDPVGTAASGHVTVNYDQTVQTPAGSFSGCFKIRLFQIARDASGQIVPQWSYDAFMWLARDAGPVKIINRASGTQWLLTALEIPQQ